jgi:hypothetical protein
MSSRPILAHHVRLRLCPGCRYLPLRAPRLYLPSAPSHLRLPSRRPDLGCRYLPSCPPGLGCRYLHLHPPDLGCQYPPLLPPDLGCRYLPSLPPDLGCRYRPSRPPDRGRRYRHFHLGHRQLPTNHDDPRARQSLGSRITGTSSSRHCKG